MQENMTPFKKLPYHVALTLDGNRRWAEKNGLPRKKGIRFGVEKTKEVMYDWTRRFEKEFGVKPFTELTIHALTLNNINLRPNEEIKEVTDAFTETFREARVKKLYDEVRVTFGGRIELLPKSLQKEMKLLEKVTKDFTKYQFNVAIAYDGNDELDNAINMAAIKGIPNKPSDLMFFPNAHPIDLFIRTSGEKRLSGFMLYYIGYAEIFFLNCLAEDFKYSNFVNILREYSDKRDRRFGQ